MVDVYCRIVLTATRGRVGCQVTTTIYAVVNRTAIDIDIDRVLRSTEEVVTTKDLVDSTT